MEVGGKRTGDEKGKERQHETTAVFGSAVLRNLKFLKSEKAAGFVSLLAYLNFEVSNRFSFVAVGG